ncbi:uracil-DNA glycosylase [Clostridium sp.]|jgi:DNA polymerase|uniref:uracil-DNA glycosylase n=1 Tax=Clostridium sp. TaxID=1506 RepID=UPI0025845725|nr:uracil-DNA glycosylase [Clostridium sp.]MDF2505690.1 uracil-DNA glycosylase family protein [Clostridium sp.]
MTLEDLEIKIKNISENYKAEPIGGWITGDGPVPCDILFVGEAPGKTEVETGKPFVGLAGKTFEKYLNSVGLYRKNVRITNTCFFRPIKLKISKANKTTISNRPPKIPEINLFREILNEEIKIVNPKLIITLGNIPLKRLTDFKSIGECHGKVVFNSIIGKYIFPMYHPSSLTYNRNDEFLRLYENDWSLLKNLLKTI